MTDRQKTTHTTAKIGAISSPSLGSAYHPLNRSNDMHKCHQRRPIKRAQRDAKATRSRGLWACTPYTTHDEVDTRAESPTKTPRQTKERRNSPHDQTANKPFDSPFPTVTLCACVEFLGEFGATPRCQENLEFGAVSGELGPRKAIAQIARQV